MSVAKGFQVGFGLSNDAFEGQRRDVQRKEELGLRRQGLEADAANRAETIGLRRDELAATAGYRGSELKLRREKQEADAKQAATEAELKAGYYETLGRNAGNEELRQQNAAARAAAEQDRADNDSRRVEVIEAAEERKQEEYTRTKRQREMEDGKKLILRDLVSPGVIPTEKLQEAYSLLDGTYMNPVAMLNPRVGQILNIGKQFASGQRSDYRSPDFKDAIDFVLDLDMGKMKGEVGEGGVIDNMDVAEVVRGQNGGFMVRLNVTPEDGEPYQAWLTKGRTPGSEPQEIQSELLFDRLTAYGAMRYAYTSSAEMRNKVRQQVIRTSPDRTTAATDRAKERYELEYSKDVRAELIANSQPVPTLSSFIDEELGREFGPKHVPSNERMEQLYRELHPEDTDEELALLGPKGLKRLWEAGELK